MGTKARLKPEPKLSKRTKIKSSAMVEELREAYSAKERAEQLLTNLEKLKSEVSAIEARYNVLTADYAKICDEAISRLSTVKTTIDKDLESKVGDLQIFKLGMSNLEARLKLGLVPVNTYLKHEEKVTPLVGLQVVIDKAANFIELGLDRMGDGIISLGEKMANLSTSISKVGTRK